MTDTSPRVLAFTGSLRRRSFNRLALRYAIEGAREAGGSVEELGPDALVLPLYNADLEREGRFPDTVEAWRATVRACDALLIASPEYNLKDSGQAADLAALGRALVLAARAGVGRL